MDILMTDDLKMKLMECNNRCIRKIANNCRNDNLSPYMSMNTLYYLKEDFNKYKDELDDEEAKALSNDLKVIEDYMIRNDLW